MGFFKKSRHAKHGKEDYVLPITETAVEPLEYKVNPDGPTAHAPHALTASEVLGQASVTQTPPEKIEMQGAISTVSPLDALRKRVKSSQKGTEEPESIVRSVKQNEEAVTVIPSYVKKSSENDEQADKNNTLLEKCMPFITEGGQSAPEEKPDYTLESVESIINLTEKKFAKLFEELQIDRTKIKYDSLGNSDNLQKPEVEKEEPKKPTVFEEIPMEKVKLPEVTQVVAISDIDPDIDSTRIVSLPKEMGQTEFEDIKSSTRVLDLSSEMFEAPPESDKIENLPELSEDDDFEVADDYRSADDTKRVAGKLRLKRRNSFIKAFLNILITLIMSLIFIPELETALLTTPKSFYITLTAIFAVMVAVNFDVLLSIKTLFTKRKKSSAALGVALIVALAYSVFCVFNNENPFDVIYISFVSLSFNAMANFMFANTVYNNFRVIAGNNEKFGIKLIDDKQTTFAMARSSIEGDVLAASSVKTVNVKDFLKNTYSDTALCGVLGKLMIAVLSVSLIAAIIMAIKEMSFLMFLQVVSLSLLCFAAPVLLLTDILPLRSASKRLNRCGAMLTGVKAAKKLEIANAITLTSSQLFPDGTLSLHDIKVLDNNKIDATLIDAAAITAEIDSPLKSIFNSIAKTTPIDIPEADTIKYEERLGISGWIKDRRIFIGNRTLLEAHGISTPPMEVDRKILRQGYFPVYLAVNSKPCALLVVKYNVKSNIAVRLQKLANIGITFLVDSCDPNLTSEMISDYFGLYPESVRVMGGLGCQLNKNTTEFQEDFSSVAAYKGNLTGLLQIFSAAGKIKKCVNFGAGLHITLSLALLLFFVYSTLTGAVMPFQNMTVLLGNIIAFIVYIIVYLFRKP